jgi:hypothetical protein
MQHACCNEDRMMPPGLLVCCCRGGCCCWSCCTLSTTCRSSGDVAETAAVGADVPHSWLLPLPLHLHLRLPLAAPPCSEAARTCASEAPSPTRSAATSADRCCIAA